jgi:hypothetical protein
MWVVAIALLALLIIVAAHAFTRREPYANQARIAAHLATKQDVADALSSSEQSYFAALDDENLRARRFDGGRQYMAVVEDSVLYNLSVDHLRRLENAISEADSAIANAGFARLADVPWKIAVFDTHRVENGLPHTHGDVIFVPLSLMYGPSSRRTRVLVHEKVHVLQRRRSPDALIAAWGFRKACRFDALGRTSRRANPDLNEFAYERDGKVAMQILRKNARSLMDSDVSENWMRDKEKRIRDMQSEHPYEIMACVVAGLAMKDDALSRWPEVSAYMQ